MASIHGVGELETSHPAVVDRVWDHFLVERFKAYAEKLAKK